MEEVVFDVETVPTEQRPMGEQDALRAGSWDIYQRADRKGAVADIDGLGFRNFGAIRKVGRTDSEAVKGPAAGS